MSSGKTLCVICHCPTDDYIEWKDSNIIIKIYCCKAHHESLTYVSNMKVVMDTAKKVVRLGRLKCLKEKTLAEIQSHIDEAEQKMLDTIVNF